jgi:threonine 3-dehydrogenase
MRALVKRDRGPGLVMTDVPEPEIGINDVLIRVGRTGVCGTDLHIEEWNDWAERTVPVPLVIGHEFVGVVAEVGSNVSDFRPGDLVSGEGHVVCGRCRNSWPAGATSAPTPRASASTGPARSPISSRFR